MQLERLPIRTVSQSVSQPKLYKRAIWKSRTKLTPPSPVFLSARCARSPVTEVQSPTYTAHPVDSAHPNEPRIQKQPRPSCPAPSPRPLNLPTRTSRSSHFPPTGVAALRTTDVPLPSKRSSAILSLLIHSDRTPCISAPSIPYLRIFFICRLFYYFTPVPHRIYDIPDFLMISSSSCFLYISPHTISCAFFCHIYRIIAYIPAYCNIMSTSSLRASIRPSFYTFSSCAATSSRFHLDDVAIVVTKALTPVVA